MKFNNDLSKKYKKILFEYAFSFSEFETSIRKERQMDGIRVKKHKFRGRGQTIDIKKVKTLKNEGLGATAIAKKMNIDRTSVYRLLKQEKV